MCIGQAHYYCLHIVDVQTLCYLIPLILIIGKLQKEVHAQTP